MNARENLLEMIARLKQQEWDGDAADLHAIDDLLRDMTNAIHKGWRTQETALSLIERARALGYGDK